MTRKLDDTSYKIRLLRGLSSAINTALNNYSQSGEILYATDSKQVYVHDGTEFGRISMIRTSSAADPTTTEYPNDKDAGIHKNTTSGNVYLAYNNAGAIVKTQLT